MDYQEYERRKRAIEDQMIADLELIRAGYRAKLQALETLWLGSPPERRPALSEKTAMDETQEETLASAEIEAPASVETQTADPLPSETPPSATPAPAAPPRVTRRGDVLYEILDTYPLLPEVFDKADVVRLLGYEPSRPTLHRAWQRLMEEGKIVMHLASDGRRPTRFRKLAPEEKASGAVS